MSNEFSFWDESEESKDKNPAPVMEKVQTKITEPLVEPERKPVVAVADVAPIPAVAQPMEVLPSTSDHPLKDSKELQEFLDEDPLPQLNGSDYPQEFLDCVTQIQNNYKKLPRLNYQAIYEELGGLSVTISQSPTLATISSEMEKIQSYKDRVSEILTRVDRCFRIKDRAVDILSDGWLKFTDEKNADKRKGDAAYRISQFQMDLAETDALLRTCNHIATNLESIHETLSRRITVMSLQLKLRDLSRLNLDVDFGKATYNKADFSDIDDVAKLDVKLDPENRLNNSVNSFDGTTSPF
jgi:hypothetical protein